MIRMHFHYAWPRGILLAMVIAAADRNTGKIALRRAHGQQPPMSPQFKPGRFSTKRGAIELRDVVVYVDGRADNTGTLEFAAALAFEHGAHLIGVFIQPELALSRAEMFVRGTGIEDVVAGLCSRASPVVTGFARSGDLSHRQIPASRPCTRGTATSPWWRARMLGI